MEYGEDFALVQGSLISVQKSIGDLHNLSLQNGDDMKINTVLDAISENVRSRGIQLENVSDSSQDQSLRRIHMFLVLNTSLRIQDKLVDDVNCAHIADCAPNLSKDLLIEFVWKFSLQKYLCETVIYCPLSLTEELLDIVIGKVNSTEPFEALSSVEQLCYAFYCKFIRLESCQEREKVCAKAKLLTYFKKCLQFFVKSDVSGLKRAKLKEIFKFAGFAMRCIMTLVTKCVKLYLNSSEQKTFMIDMYEMSLPELYDTTDVEMVTSDNFIQELLFVCKVNCCAITVDMWLFWAECSTDEEGEITLQSVIGEEMYACVEELKKIKDGETKFPLASELISMLSSMAVKPKDEDDEIRQADIETVIENVQNKSKSQEKWFKALIRRNENMSNEKYLECLRNYLHLAEYEDVKLIFASSIEALNSLLPDESHDQVKLIALDSIGFLALEHQVCMVEWYFQTYGFGMKLMTSNFHVVLTETFNKAVNVTEKKDQILSEFLSLFMQSPMEVITKAIHEALLNSKQISLIVHLLEHPARIYSICDVESIAINSRNEKLSVINSVLFNAMKNCFTEVEESNFLILVAALTNHNIINGTEFIEKCLLHALYDSFGQRKWSQLLLWLKLLHSFINGTIKHDIVMPQCILLVMLAQILEASRWNILTYSSGAMSVCEEALAIIKSLVKTFLDSKEVEDKEVKWLQFKLDRLLSPLNKSYFNQLWCQFGKACSSEACNNVDTFLLDVLQCDYFDNNLHGRAIEIFQDVDNIEKLLLFSFSKLLPICTASEWKVLAQRMTAMSIFNNKANNSVPVVHLFANSVLLLLTVTKKDGIQENECTLSCLDYSVRNLGLLLKEEIPQLKCLSTETQMKVLIKILYIIAQLPTTLKDSCAILMVNVLLELLPEALSGEKEETIDSAACVETSFVKDISTSIGILGNGEPLQVLARKLVECMAKETE